MVARVASSRFNWWFWSTEDFEAMTKQELKYREHADRILKGDIPDAYLVAAQNALMTKPPKAKKEVVAPEARPHWTNDRVHLNFQIRRDRAGKNRPFKTKENV